MTSTNCRISPLILEELSHGEKRILSLVVSIRKVLARTEVFKGDLPAVVKLALRKLIASGTVYEIDGVYTIRRPR